MLVRTLVDLLIVLLYITQDTSNETVNRYMAYDWVMRQKMYGEFKNEPEVIKKIEKRKVNPKPNDSTTEIIEEQAQLAKAKYKYGKDWSDKNIREMAKAVDKEKLYTTVYKLQSQLSHTNMRAMNEYVSEKEGNFIIEIGSSERWITEALVSTFDCFYNIVGEFDKVLQLGYAKKLDAVAEKYIKEISEINKKAEK